MNTTTRIAIFGACSGLCWSSAPIFFSDRSLRTFVLSLIVGIVTGIVVSFALYKPLLKSNRLGILIFGFLSLPFGAFCFGVCGGLADLVTRYSTGEIFAPTPLNPFIQGLLYAWLAMCVCFTSPFGLILFPAAMMTTYLLRKAILWEGTPTEPI
jgi:MFS family permease